MGFATRWFLATLVVLNVVLIGSIVVEMLRPPPPPPPDPMDLARARAKCREYQDAAMMWKRIRKRFPGRLELMEQPVEPGLDPFLKIEPDPWGTPYWIEFIGRYATVWSAGPDRQEGTDDDISYPD